MIDKNFHAGLLIGLLISQNEKANELVEAQRKIIELQQKVQDMTPPQPTDMEVHYHLQTGMFSEDAADSNSVPVVEAYQRWVMAFAVKFIKPYVNQKVFQEVTTHMTRGLISHISDLERQQMAARLGKAQAGKPGEDKLTSVH